MRVQVADTERTFAKTLVARDEQAFASFLADETVFFNGSTSISGKAVVVAERHRFFVEPDTLFSWAAEQVEVLASGTLALSSGPAFDSYGKKLASFTSIWRLEAPGMWRIGFDKGCDCVPAWSGTPRWTPVGAEPPTARLRFRGHLRPPTPPIQGVGGFPPVEPCSERARGSASLL